MARKKPRPADSEAILRCSFCNRSQAVVRQLFVGPHDVSICNECVEVCTDIVAEAAAEAAPREGSRRPWARYVAPGECALCRLPVSLDEGMSLATRGVLCRACVSEVRAALADLEPRSQ